MYVEVVDVMEIGTHRGENYFGTIGILDKVPAWLGIC